MILVFHISIKLLTWILICKYFRIFFNWILFEKMPWSRIWFRSNEWSAGKCQLPPTVNFQITYSGIQQNDNLLSKNDNNFESPRNLLSQHSWVMEIQKAKCIGLLWKLNIVKCYHEWKTYSFEQILIEQDHCAAFLSLMG